MNMPASPWARDALLAAVLTALGQAELLAAAERVEGPLMVQHFAFALMTAPVALRRRAPLPMALLGAFGLALQTAAGEAPVVAGFLAMLVALVSLGYHASWRDGVVGVGALVLAGASYELVGNEVVWGDLAGNVAIIVGVWFLARRVRAHSDARVAAELARDRAATEAAAAERSRICRDLHDSVAHALTVMTLQAGAASERVDDAATAEALEAVSDTGRRAIGDMHRILKLLGPDGAPPESPGLLDLDEVVAAAGRAGVTVELDRSGDLASVPVSVGATGYRVVQEALTNTLKHSGAGRARVRIAVEAQAVRIDVADAGGGSPRLGTGSERGLAGLRERVELFGGTLTAGSEATGGWRLSAWLPLTAQEPRWR